MEITKNQAVLLAKEFVEKAVSVDINNWDPVESLPEGATYLPGGWKASDYWLIPFSDLQQNKPLCTGGASVFIAVCKNTGETSKITVQGE